MNCGERIYKLRISRKYTREQLAREVGVPPELIAQWEEGTSLPEPGKKIVLSAILGTTVEYLDTGMESSRKASSDGVGKSSRLLYTGAVLLYLFGFLSGEFTETASLFGVPLLYYGTSPAAVVFLAGAAIMLLLGILTGFSTGK